jgi:hypothetical protein
MKWVQALRPETSVWAHRAVVAALAVLCAVVTLDTLPDLGLIPADLERRFVVGPLNLIFGAYSLLIAVVVTWKTGRRREGRHLALLLGYVAACMALSVVPSGRTEAWRQAVFAVCWLGAIVEGFKFFTTFPQVVTVDGIRGLLARARGRGWLSVADRATARATGALVGTLAAKVAFTAVAVGFAYRLIGEGSHRYNIFSDFVRPSGLPAPVEALLDLSGGLVILTVVAVAWTAFRLAGDVERKRMLWIVLAQLTVAVFTVTSLALSVLWGLTGSETIRFLRGLIAAVHHPLVWFVDLSGFALAIFHAGALDLRPVINKTTLYGALFLVLTFLFATVEQVAQNLLTDRFGVPDGFGAWLGAGTIAVAMGPIRDRIERLVRRLGKALEEDLGA